jgi:hypothetical protein
LALTSLTSGGRSVGEVLSRTKAKEFLVYVLILSSHKSAKWPITSGLQTKFLCENLSFNMQVKNTEILIYAGKKVGLEINVDKTKYMLLSRHQNVGQNRDIKIANRLFKMCHSSNIWGRQ